MTTLKTKNFYSPIFYADNTLPNAEEIDSRAFQGDTNAADRAIISHTANPAVVDAFLKDSSLSGVGLVELGD